MLALRFPSLTQWKCKDRTHATVTMVENCARYTLLHSRRPFPTRYSFASGFTWFWAIGRFYCSVSRVGVWKDESILLNAGESQRIAVGVKRRGDVRIFVTPTTGTTAKDLVGCSTRFARSRLPPDGFHATLIHGSSRGTRMMDDHKDDPRPTGLCAACRRTAQGRGQEWPCPTCHAVRFHAVTYHYGSSSTAKSALTKEGHPDRNTLTSWIGLLSIFSSVRSKPAKPRRRRQGENASISKWDPRCTSSRLERRQQEPSLFASASAWESSTAAPNLD